VTYRLNAWSGGFTATVGVSGGDAALHGWTVTWTYGGDQHVSSFWNATVVQSGANVTATNLSYNGEVSAGTLDRVRVTGHLRRQQPGADRFLDQRRPLQRWGAADHTSGHDPGDRAAHDGATHDDATHDQAADDRPTDHHPTHDHGPTSARLWLTDHL